MASLKQCQHLLEVPPLPAPLRQQPREPLAKHLVLAPQPIPLLQRPLQQRLLEVAAPRPPLGLGNLPAVHLAGPQPAAQARHSLHPLEAVLVGACPLRRAVG